jgi:hypothetical protein
VVWEPFAIAIVFGLVVSAGLYFIVMWPQVEPDEDNDDQVPLAPEPPAPVSVSMPAQPAPPAEPDPAAPPPPSDVPGS